MLTETIKIDGGEISVYQDADGYHAERWSERDQCVADQSGDRASRDAAVAAVTPPTYDD